MTIDDLLVHVDPTIQAMAQKAVLYKRELAQGKLTQHEYDMLTTQQLMDINTIYKNADEADAKQALAEAIEIIASFIGSI